MCGVGAQVIQATQTFFDPLRVHIYWQSAVPYITECHASLLVPQKCLHKLQNLSSAEATHLQRLCETFCWRMVPPTNRAVNWNACIAGLLLMVLTILFCRLLVVHISPTRTEASVTTSRDTWEWKAYIWRGALGGLKGFLWHCYHHLSAMRPLARCLTPCLRWTRALFAVLGRYSPQWRGCLGLDFGGLEWM
jgi:hypothetical protein